MFLDNPENSYPTDNVNLNNRTSMVTHPSSYNRTNIHSPPVIYNTTNNNQNSYINNNNQNTYKPNNDDYNMQQLDVDDSKDYLADNTMMSPMYGEKIFTTPRDPNKDIKPKDVMKPM